MTETNDQTSSTNDLEKWIETNGPRLFLFAQQQTGNHADAQDVYQDAIIKVLREGIESGDHSIPPLGRMFLAIKHKAIDLHRHRSSRKKRENNYAELSGEHSWFVSDIETNETHKQLQQVVHTLVPEQQEVVILKIWGDQTFKSIAEILSIPQNTAASRYRYGLSQIRSSLNLQAL